MTLRNRAGMRGQRGVGIVEILVAVLVLSIGLLGLAGLQMRTLRNNESAMERGAAVFATHAIVDAMRADRTNAVANAYNIALATATPVGSTFREQAIAAWRGNLTTLLGAGATGSVSCNGALCTIVVQWDDSRVNGGSNTYTVTTQVQL